MTTERHRRLGRGLEALIGTSQPSNSAASELQRIATARIKPNPFQPRREFDPAALAELEASIRANGLLQPITVRKKGETYELVTGERRLRAVTNLQWKDVPQLEKQGLFVVGHARAGTTALMHALNGSPHIFLGDRNWFCPSLRIAKVGDHFEVAKAGEVRAFYDAVFA